MSELKSELVVDMVSPLGGKLEIKGILELLKPIDGSVIFQINPDTGTLINTDFTLGHNDLDIPVLVLNDPSGLGFGYVTDQVTYNNNKTNPNKGIKLHTNQEGKHNTFTIGNIQGGLGNIIITPQDRVNFNGIPDKVEINTSEFVAKNSEGYQYIKTKDQNVYIGRASGSAETNYTGSNGGFLRTGSKTIITTPTEILSDVHILGNVKMGLGSITSLNEESTTIFSHFTSQTANEAILSKNYYSESFAEGSRNQLYLNSGKPNLPEDGLDGWINAAIAGDYGTLLQNTVTQGVWSAFTTDPNDAFGNLITARNIGRDNQPSILSRGSLTIGIDGINSDAQTSFFEIISGVDDISNHANSTSLLIVDKNTKTTFVQHLSSSGDLYASTSLNSSNFKTVVVDPSTGKFYHTGSYGGATGGGTFQTLSDGPGAFILINEDETTVEYAGHALQVNSTNDSLEFVKQVNSASVAATTTGTASYATTAQTTLGTASFAGNATTASYATVAQSVIVDGGITGDLTGTASYADAATTAITTSGTASHATMAESTSGTASYATTAQTTLGTASYATNATTALSTSGTASHADDATTASYATVAQSVIVDGGITGNLTGTASYADAATTASYADNTVATSFLNLLDVEDSNYTNKLNFIPRIEDVFNPNTSEYDKKLKLVNPSTIQSLNQITLALSGGINLLPDDPTHINEPFYINNGGFTTVGNGQIGGDLKVDGSVAVGAGLTISDIVISSSANAFIFGSASGNDIIHQMTGNLHLNSSTGITANMSAGATGFHGTASYAVQSTTTLGTASHANNSTNAVTASYASTAQSLLSGATTTGNLTGTASHATMADSTSGTASYANAATTALSTSGTASYANAATTALSTSGTASYANAATTALSTSGTASHATMADSTSGTASYATNATTALTANSTSGTASYANSATTAITTSGTASYANNATTASYATNADNITTTFTALTDTDVPAGTGADPYINHSVLVAGNNNKIKFVTQVNSASVAASTTGTASYANTATTALTATSTSGTASYANSATTAISTSGTASYATTAQTTLGTASYATVAQSVIVDGGIAGNLTGTASHATMAESTSGTASYADAATTATTTTNATTASYFTNPNDSLYFTQLTDIQNAVEWVSVEDGGTLGYPAGAGGKALQVHSGGKSLEFVTQVNSASVAVSTTGTASYADAATTAITTSGTASHADKAQTAVTASYATNATNATNATTATSTSGTASYATTAQTTLGTASYATVAQSLITGGTQTGNLTGTASHATMAESTSGTASYATTAQTTLGTASHADAATTALSTSGTASYANAATTALSTSGTASYANATTTALSTSGTASYATTAQTTLGTASYAGNATTAINATNATNATTASYATTAQTTLGTASYAGAATTALTASYIDATVTIQGTTENAVSASYATTAQTVIGGIQNAVSASYATTAQTTLGTASYATTAQTTLGTASYATTAQTTLGTASYAGAATTALSTSGTASYATTAQTTLGTASFAGDATSASYATTAQTTLGTASYATTAQTTLGTASYAGAATTALTASYATVAQSLITGGTHTGNLTGTASHATMAESTSGTASYATVAQSLITGGTHTGNLTGTASHATMAESTSGTASYATTATTAITTSGTASYATTAQTTLGTASFANNISPLSIQDLSNTPTDVGNNNQVLVWDNGGNITYTDTVLTATTATSTSGTASYATTAQTTLGTASYATVAQSVIAGGGIAGNLTGTASHATMAESTSGTASYATTAQTTLGTASYATTAQTTLGTASYAEDAASASYANNATTASFASNTAPSFPFAGEAIITGSLNLTNLYEQLPSLTESDSEYVVSSITPFNGYAAWKAFDDSLSFVNSTLINNVGDGVTIDYNVYGKFGYSPIINKISIHFNATTNCNKQIQISGSNNGNTWTPLGAESSPSEVLIRTLNFNNTTDYKQYRFTFPGDQAAISNTLVIEGISLFTAEANVIATSFTGSLLGTASYADKALTASYALNASDITTTFLALTDTPASGSNGYAGANYGAGNIAVVNSGQTGLEFVSSFAGTASYADTATTAISTSGTASHATMAESTSGTASYATTAQTTLGTASYAGAATTAISTSGTASHATMAESTSGTASYATTAQTTLGTASYATTAQTTLGTASYATTAQTTLGTASYANAATTAISTSGTASYATTAQTTLGTASYATTAQTTLGTASYATTAQTTLGTASYANAATTALTASYIDATVTIQGTTENAVSASHATVAESGGLPNTTFHIAHNANVAGDLNVDGSVAVGAGLTISDIVISSSANAFIFGSASGNDIIHQMTGNLHLNSSTGITANMSANTVGFIGTASAAVTTSGTASYANSALTATSTSGTASYADDATSASYATTAQTTLGTASYAGNATSASYALNATTASFAITSSYSHFAQKANKAESSSYSLVATSASYVDLSYLDLIDTTDTTFSNKNHFIPIVDNGVLSLKSKVKSASFAETSSLAYNAHRAQTASFSFTSLTSSYSLNSDTTYLSLLDTNDLDFVNKNGFVPVVREAGVNDDNPSQLHLLETVPSASVAVTASHINGTVLSASYADTALTASYLNGVVDGVVENATSASYAEYAENSGNSETTDKVKIFPSTPSEYKLTMVSVDIPAPGYSPNEPAPARRVHENSDLIYNSNVGRFGIGGGFSASYGLLQIKSKLHIAGALTADGELLTFQPQGGGQYSYNAGVLLGKSQGLYAAATSSLQNISVPYYRLAVNDVQKRIVIFGDANGPGVGNTYIEAGNRNSFPPSEQINQDTSILNNEATGGTAIIFNPIPGMSTPTNPANWPVFITGSVNGKSGGWMGIKSGLHIGSTSGKLKRNALTIGQSRPDFNPSGDSSTITFDVDSDSGYTVSHKLGSPPTNDSPNYNGGYIIRNNAVANGYPIRFRGATKDLVSIDPSSGNMIIGGAEGGFGSIFPAVIDEDTANIQGYKLKVNGEFGVSGKAYFHDTVVVQNPDTQTFNPVLAASFLQGSDKRLKENIKKLTPQLNIVKKLNPVTYNIKTDKNKKSQIGLIAQEVQKLIPEIVSTISDKDNILGVNYDALTPVLVKAMQEQQKLIEKLSARIDELEKR